MTIDAKQVQTLLLRLGYSPGPVDGIWGPNSQLALDAALKELGREETPAQEDGPAWWADIRHFKRAEMRCPCGKCNGFPVEPEERLMRILDTDIWEHFNRPIAIIPLSGNPHAGGSGVRCQAYNDSLPGSVPNSRHTQGKAADIIVSGFSGEMVNAYCQTLVARGVLNYAYQIGGGQSVHVDIK